MTKADIWWNTANSIAIVIFYFVILFCNGDFPMIKDRLTQVENKVEMINYHLQCPTNVRDTIVINYYQQTPTKKK